MCPECDNRRSTILETTYNRKQGELYRKRKCDECGAEFFTVEFIVENNKRFQKDWFANRRKIKK